MKAKHVVFLILVMACQMVWGLDVPKLKGRVNDYTGTTLDASQIAKLNAKLKTFEDSTSNQVVILIMKSLDGEDLEDFSMKVAESWKIGQKGKDNGVILLFSMDEKKHESRMEVGYGLESVLPDAIAKWILDKEIKPRFKEKQYYEGIDVAIDKIILCTTGEYQKQIAPAMEQEKKDHLALILFVVLAIFAGLIGYMHWSASGIVGGVGSSIIWIIVFGAASIATIAIAVVIGLIGGLLAHGILSIGFGGGISGSDFGDGVVFSAGGGDGGGFSGGGGSFGGGGASGSW